MAQNNKTALKVFFQKGKQPTEAQFASLIESDFNLQEGGTQTASGSLSLQNITASGDISASGTIFANNFESVGGNVDGITFSDDLKLTGDITASGNVSASGNVLASGNVTTDGNLQVNGNTTLGNASTDSISITGQTLFTGDITASANISASGTIFANNFQSAGGNVDGVSFTDHINITGNMTASGDISASGVITTSDITVRTEHPKLNLKADGGNGDPQIRMENSVGDTVGFFRAAVTNNTSSHVSIGADTTDPNSHASHEKHLVLSSSGTVGIGTLTPTSKLQVAGDIFASGSNGDITATGNTTLGTLATHTHTFVGNITASGNIDATGTISSSHVTIQDEHPVLTLRSNAANGDQQIKFKSGDGSTMLTMRSDVTSNTINHFVMGIGTNETQFVIDANGKIGMGTQTPLEVLHVVGNITSSGNISAAGDVTASKFIGDGSGLTNVSALVTEWDGTRNGDARITGSLFISGAGATELDVEGSVDISGDIDVDGTTNLDNTDIDGTLTMDGAGFSLDSAGAASNITVASDGAADDLTISVTGATDSSLIISSSGTGTDSLVIGANAGDMLIGPYLADGKTLKIGKNGAVEAIFAPHGTPVNETFLLTNTAGTSADAIQLLAASGGVHLRGSTGIQLTGAVSASTSIAVGTDLFHLGDPDTKIGFDTDDITITVGGEQMLKFTEDGSQDKIIFGDGGDIDFEFAGTGAFKFTTDNTDHAIQQHDGTEVARIHDGGSSQASGMTAVSPGFGFKRPVMAITADSGDATVALSEDDSGAIIHLDADTNNIIINLPVVDATTKIGTEFTFVTTTAVNGSKSIVINTAGTDGNDNFLMHNHSKNAFDHSGDTITIPSSSPIGTAVRVTCLASGGSNAAELWLVEAFSDNIAITNT